MDEWVKKSEPYTPTWETLGKEGSILFFQTEGGKYNKYEVINGKLEFVEEVDTEK